MNDIEIYMRDPDQAKLEAWLAASFERIELRPFPSGNGYSGVGELAGQKIPLKLFFKAVGKYATLLVESTDGPWQDDMSCARDAWAALGKEVRYATTNWKEGEPVDDDLWWSLTEAGETQVHWKI